MVPSTGKSISRAPAASTTGASSRPVIGCSVLMSMNSLPRTSPDRNPSLPRKMFRTPLSSVMIEITVVGGIGDRARMRRDRHAVVGGGLHRDRVAVPADHLEAVAGEPRLDGAAHAAESDEADLHRSAYVRPVAFCAAVKWP